MHSERLLGPVAEVIPRLDGVCNIGGQLIAVFGYDSSSTVNQRLPYGTPDNVFLVNGTVQTDPSPTPPSWFLPGPGSHLGVFAPTFAAGDTVTWTHGRDGCLRQRFIDSSRLRSFRDRGQ